MLVLTHVIVAVFIDGFRFVAAKIACHQTHGLFVGFYELCLRGVCDTSDARRQDIVDGFLVVVLLDADCADFNNTTTAGRCVAVVERLLICSPVALYKVECGKTKDGFFFEACHEDTHEAYACEIAYVSFLALIFLQWDAEEVPCAFICVAITKFHACGSFVGNMVASHHHILWSDTYVILVVFLVFVQGVVLIDVFNIRCRFPCCFVAFCPCVGVGTVALRHVDALVAIKDGHAELVEVCSAVVVIVVVGGVGVDAVIY